MSKKEARISPIRRNLECPICLETCSPPIYICVNGHIVCKRCRQQTSMCGVCRAPGKPSMRCISLDNVALAMSGMLATAGGSTVDTVEDPRYQCKICKVWSGLTAKALMGHVKQSHPLNFHNFFPRVYKTFKTSFFKRAVRAGVDVTNFFLIYGHKKLFWLKLGIEFPAQTVKSAVYVLDNKPMVGKELLYFHFRIISNHVFLDQFNADLFCQPIDAQDTSLDFEFPRKMVDYVCKVKVVRFIFTMK